jgi:signal peptidase II
MRTEARTTELKQSSLAHCLMLVAVPLLLIQDWYAKVRSSQINGVPLLHWMIFFVLTPSLLTWDLYSKWLVFTTLGYEYIQSDSWFVWLWGENVFRLMTSFNHGALWGMGQGLSWLFALLSVIAALAVVFWLFFARGAQSLWLTVALAFVLAGTLGNLYDRLGLHGLRNDKTGLIEYAVRDFLYFEIIEWPIFNFADTFLVTGAIMLLIKSFQADAAAKRAEALTGAQPASGPSV